MLRWIKKKCIRKHSKRLRTSSISDLSRSHDYTSHPETNVYHEIDEDQIALAYAVTSIDDLIDAIPTTLPDVCPLCRCHRYGRYAACNCLEQESVPSPYTIRNDLTDDDDFSWLEYDMKSSKNTSLNRSQSEIKRPYSHRFNPHQRPKTASGFAADDSSSSSGYYETDESCDDILAGTKTKQVCQPHRHPENYRTQQSPCRTPKMGCRVIKRTQSAVNPNRNRTLRKSQSDYFSPLCINEPSDKHVPSDHRVKQESQVHSYNIYVSEDEEDEDDDMFDHLYTNVCIDINNLEIPKLRKSSYKSRNHGQNRLLNDLLKLNYDKQCGVRR